MEFFCWLQINKSRHCEGLRRQALAQPQQQRSNPAAGCAASVAGLLRFARNDTNNKYLVKLYVFCVFFVCLFMPSPIYAQQELLEISEKINHSAKELRAAEMELVRVNAEIEKVTMEEQDMLSVMLADRQKLAELLLVLQRMSRIPPIAIIAQEKNRNDIVHSEIMLRNTAPVLLAQAKELSENLEKLAALRQGLAEQYKVSEKAKKEIAKRHSALISMLSERKRLLQDGEPLEAPKAVVVKDSANSLMREFAKTEAKNNLSTDMREFRYPAIGRLKSGFGEKSPAGSRAMGVTLETLPSAVVTSPLGGLVKFRGNLKGYGKVLVLEHAGGYHSLIAGVDRFETKVDRRVEAGEPIAVMAGNAKNLDLYYELRHNGEAIDPATLTSGN